MGWMWQLTVPGYIAAARDLRHAATALASLAAPTGRWRVLGRPAALSLVEALRFSFPFGGVPLASLGISQVSGPLVGIARVGGVILLTWVVFSARLRPRRGDRRRARPAAATGSRSGRSAPSSSCWRCRSSRPRGTDTGRDARRRRRPGRRRAGHQRARRAEQRRHRTPPRGDARRSSPTRRIDVVVWPENVVDTDDFAASEQLAGDRAPRPPASACRSPSASPRTCRASPARSPTPRSSSRPDGDRDEPLRQGAPRAVRRVRPAARHPRVARRAGRPGPDERRRRHRRRPCIDAARRHADWPWSSRGRCSSAGGPGRASRHGGEVIINPTNGASYTGTILQTQQVASSRLRAIETGRWVVQAAPTGFSEFVTPRRRRHRPHGGQRAGRHPPRRRAAHRPHLVRHRSATARGSCCSLLELAVAVGAAPGRAVTPRRRRAHAGPAASASRAPV